MKAIKVAISIITVLVLSSMLFAGAEKEVKVFQKSNAELDNPQVTALDMIKPDMFPNAQFGMSVESVNDGPIAKVVTTGGEFIIDKAKDTIECRQRISKERTVATISLAQGTLKDAKLSHKASGSAIFSGAGGTIRINGDSLLMIQPSSNGNIKAALAFTPDYHSVYYNNYNFFDPDGGISFFEHEKCPESEFQAAVDPVTVTWPWKGGDVFWASVSPPKPYDWDYPLNNKTIMYGSSIDRYMYPSDIQILRWSHMANIFFLHNEDMFKQWQLDLTPKNPAELRRVINSAHEFGMKIMVYTTPMAFLKGTSAEFMATESVNNPKSTGWRTGSNVRLYLEQATRLVKEYNLDGLYWDGMYLSRRGLAANYFLSRAARELVGDNGILEFHASEDNLGDGYDGTYCPTPHAYMNFVIKGEGHQHRIGPGYNRYYISTYNTSNCVGVENFFNFPPTPEQVERRLKANVHFHFPEYTVYTNQDEVYREVYWPRLTTDLKRQISTDLQKRTGVFETYRDSVLKNRK